MILICSSHGNFTTLMVTLGKVPPSPKKQKNKNYHLFSATPFSFPSANYCIEIPTPKTRFKKMEKNQIKVLPDRELWYIHKSQHRQFHLRKEKCLPDQKNARGNCSLHVITSKIKTCQMQFFYLEPDNRASKHNYCSLSCKRISEIPPGINLLRS